MLGFEMRGGRKNKSGAKFNLLCVMIMRLRGELVHALVILFDLEF
jgi:hypothetical protein